MKSLTLALMSFCTLPLFIEVAGAEMTAGMVKCCEAWSMIEEFDKEDGIWDFEKGDGIWDFEKEDGIGDFEKGDWVEEFDKKDGIEEFCV